MNRWNFAARSNQLLLRCSRRTRSRQLSWGSGESIQMRPRSSPSLRRTCIAGGPNSCESMPFSTGRMMPSGSFCSSLTCHIARSTILGTHRCQMQPHTTLGIESSFPHPVLSFFIHRRYTSLGTRLDSFPNPHLQKTADELSAGAAAALPPHWPAHRLADGSLERAGRSDKKNYAAKQSVEAADQAAAAAAHATASTAST